MAPHASSNLLPPDLTAGEERVLPYLCAGWTDHAIAIELGLADATVHRHTESCLRKFGLTDRGALAARLLHGKRPVGPAR